MTQPVVSACWSECGRILGLIVKSFVEPRD